MKKIVAGLMALSMLAPSAVMASSATEALSVRNVAIQPVRAGAPKGKTQAVGTPLIILGLLVVVGGGILLLDGDGGDSN